MVIKRKRPSNSQTTPSSTNQSTDGNDDVLKSDKRGRRKKNDGEYESGSKSTRGSGNGNTKRKSDSIKLKFKVYKPEEHEYIDSPDYAGEEDESVISESLDPADPSDPDYYRTRKGQSQSREASHTTSAKNNPTSKKWKPRRWQVRKVELPTTGGGFVVPLWCMGGQFGSKVGTRNDDVDYFAIKASIRCRLRFSSGIRKLVLSTK
ncbi:9497_t:CDS:2 [Paraglomus occultum]|uniref:9497_t:CDS:1 n=1 Tax=Paraglomus occultum TaxID=144539 RepID=A0A9N9G0C5_9GLOM|nr:9497_t:CDS:2 [Paraglomus occultum]